ncbi:hypothetical protein B481_0565 [Planococcus halocryophilus Or1]|nr:hypothetical protein B481_0565 [Planococcus halocryophilus Or1]
MNTETITHSGRTILEEVVLGIGLSFLAKVMELSYEQKLL